MPSHAIFAGALVFGVVSSSVAADAPEFPDRSKTLRIVVPFAAGGGVDNAARAIGEQLRKRLNLPVIVDNKPGGSGTLGGRTVQTAPADGYTLLFSASTHVLAKQVLAKPPYDPQTEFAPVARIGEAPLLLVIAPQHPQNKLAEVVAGAKEQPGKWTAAIPAVGAASHLATLLLAQQGGIQFSYIAYKGTQPAMVDVAGGHVDVLMDSMISLQQLARTGKVKPIAITSRERNPQLPDVPTVREGGLTDFSFASWYGFWAPKGDAGRSHHQAERVDQLGGPGAGQGKHVRQPGHRPGQRNARGLSAPHRQRRGPGHRTC